MSSFIEQQNTQTHQFSEVGPENVLQKIQKAFKEVLWSDLFCGLVFITLFAIIVPTLVYFLIFDESTFPAENIHSCLVNTTYRTPCGKPNTTEEGCHEISCCFDNDTQSCYHYVPSYYYYTKTGELYESSKKLSPIKTKTQQIQITTQEIGANIFKVIVHGSEIKYDEKTTENKTYYYVKNDTMFSINVYRNENHDLILSTAKGPLIISENYWEWTFQLTDEYLFGLGETLIEPFTKIIYRNRDDHNTLPTFLAYKNGSFHGLTVYHEGPLEVIVLPSYLVVLRSLAGSYIELELYMGPTPKDVVQQRNLNFNKEATPRWILGTHICRDGGSLNFDEILNEVDNFNNDGYQTQSDCIHENLLFWIINSTSEQQDRLKTAIRNLTDNGKRFVLSVPPQIPVNTTFYQNLNLDVFYKYSNGSIYKGEYLEKNVTYPDFANDKIGEYVSKLLETVQNAIGSTPDALVLRDNWPLDESFLMDNESLPYLTKGIIEAMSKTLPWNLTSKSGQHITNHNNYGSLQLKALRNNEALKNISIFSASNDFNLNTPLIIQNVNISWTNLKKTIRTSLYNSLFASPLVGIPICGSTNDYNKTTQESLCIRWYLMASTMPLFRISSDYPRRDPNNLNSLYATKLAKSALEIRNKLLDYFFTILNQGEPLIRPMFYDFYENTTTLFLDEQYMIGGKLLVAQPVLPSQSKLRVYLPPESEVWYEFWNGEKFLVKKETPWIDFNVVEGDWIAFLAQGSIIPLITAQENTTLDLTVALNITSKTADGALLVGSSLVYFHSTDKSIKLSGLLKAQDSMNCNSKSYDLNQVKIYNNESTSVKSISINLCKQSEDDVEFSFPQ